MLNLQILFNFGADKINGMKKVLFTFLQWEKDLSQEAFVIQVVVLKLQNNCVTLSYLLLYL